MNGHRLLAHTADTIVEAWGRDLPECLAEAVRGLVESFADTSAAPVSHSLAVGLSGPTPEELLLGLLDEVVYRLDADGLVTTGASVTVEGASVVATLELARAEDVVQIGSPPKAVSRHELYVGQSEGEWTCRFLVDV